MIAGLVYVSPGTLPGISRQRTPDGFVYRLPDGSVLRAEADLERIRRLAIPPAYDDVWICPLPHGHMQFTGRDARGRRQYGYHAEWTAQRSCDKFERIEAFGHVLPRIRRRVARDLRVAATELVSHRALLAALVRLLDTAYIRVGNTEYATRNRSFGLTTLRNHHAIFVGRELRLSFRGKHAIRHTLRITDARVVDIVRRCKQLPGQELFQFEENGHVHGVDSGDVNDYVSEAAGERFTAKDFRTWHGSVLALELIREALSGGSDQGTGTFTVAKLLAEVAKQLGNTATVCRKSYVHPAVLTLAQSVLTDHESTAQRVMQLDRKTDGPRALYAAERRFLGLLAEQGGVLPIRQTATRRRSSAA